MGSNAALIEFSSPAAMAARIADLMQSGIDRAVAAQGLASIALSGGSTPSLLYLALASRPIDWANVAATLVDERFVPPTAAGSNEAFLRSTFLQGAAGRARFVGLWNDAHSLEMAAARATAGVRNLVRPFDIVVLGMGLDGHAASWFPQAAGLAAALAADAPLVVPVRATRSDATGEYTERLTLSLQAIADARLIILMLTGAEKRAAFEKFSVPGPVEEAPIRAILAARPDIWACWAP
ncbi:MAG: 6-phosphogluconolactonase [Parvularculaceae bacterium]|nr:6-phosphogluconolactonase [Parvularculaceae bacterium]